MNKIKILYLGFFAALVMLSTSCKKDLEVGNPNSPTLGGNVTEENGLTKLAQGGVYLNGLSYGDGWLGDSYFSLPRGYHEEMGDIIGGGEGSNNQITTLPSPETIKLSSTVTLTNPSPNPSIIRAFNSRAATAQGNNALMYEWMNMYAMQQACNNVIALADKVTYTGDKATKIATIKAWSYFWKGWAYAQIGTMYYAGIITDSAGITSNNYVSHDAVIARSNYYYDLAVTTLGAASNTAEYTATLGKLIPASSQVGNGQIMTKEMWARNVNTLKARNILLNKMSTFVNGVAGVSISKNAFTGVMSTADWNTVLTLTANGVKSSDYVLTGRTTDLNSWFGIYGGTASALTTNKASGGTFKISERFVQEFATGDKRKESNFKEGYQFTHGFSFGTRWSLNPSWQTTDLPGGGTIAGVYSYGTKNVGKYELIIAASYEENAMMQAEANIQLGNIATGLGFIDAVRTYQGAGLAAATALTKADALTLLTKERRVALAFRGLSFYDARRWGWTYPIANGGGRYGCTVFDIKEVVWTNATINYNYMDYWDVPGDEFELNAPSATSVAIKNPNF
ncbi:MAG: RagB/SusD family nutrient uptake outer membrane protein [Sediminibacterium sp.]|jgi:hypothetical protein|nr:MAG: RagB/SusD family nutrient uptake outer membrane protein [Sediminibacterium sp.]